MMYHSQDKRWLDFLQLARTECLYLRLIKSSDDPLELSGEEQVLLDHSHCWDVQLVLIELPLTLYLQF